MSKTDVGRFGMIAGQTKPMTNCRSTPLLLVSLNSLQATTTMRLLMEMRRPTLLQLLLLQSVLPVCHVITGKPRGRSRARRRYSISTRKVIFTAPLRFCLSVRPYVTVL